MPNPLNTECAYEDIEEVTSIINIGVESIIDFINACQDFSPSLQQMREGK